MNEEKDVKKEEQKRGKVKKIKEVESPVKAGLKSKADIVQNWLPRYTGRPLADFGQYILLTNFSKYVQMFSEWHDNAPVMGLDKPMQSVTADGITIINFGMGSPMAATMYADAFFNKEKSGMGFDAITVAPYMGKDSVGPFLNHKDKWVILLALTSNIGHSYRIGYCLPLCVGPGNTYGNYGGYWQGCRARDIN